MYAHFTCFDAICAQARTNGIFTIWSMNRSAICLKTETQPLTRAKTRYTGFDRVFALSSEQTRQ